ncbi:MAG: DUF429 domain-containing protein [Pseudomonadales bacterium]
MHVVGIDGCKVGWCCVELADNGSWSIDVMPDIGEVWRRFRGASAIFIDVPIGLRDFGSDQRHCEIEARRCLGRRHSTVFTPPLRSSLAFNSYEEASANNFKLAGKKLSRQAWGILPKIAEVDRFLNDCVSARSVLSEVHPELLFCNLNNWVPMSKGKKSAAGKRERSELLRRHFSHTGDVFNQFRKQFLKREVADDDVYDAMIAAVCALKCQTRGCSTFPVHPERDSHGLPMQMVFPGKSVN